MSAIHSRTSSLGLMAFAEIRILVYCYLHGVYDNVLQPKRTADDVKTHVSILVFFNTEENLRSWLLSEERAYWLNRAKDEILFEARDIDMHKGGDFCV